MRTRYGTLFGSSRLEVESNRPPQIKRLQGIFAFLRREKNLIRSKSLRGT